MSNPICDAVEGGKGWLLGDARPEPERELERSVTKSLQSRVTFVTNWGFTGSIDRRTMQDENPMQAPLPPDRPLESPERGSSMIEYVGLGAIAAMLVSGLAAAVNSGAGERLGAAVVRRLIDVIGAG